MAAPGGTARITFHGAAGEVTGSRHLLETAGSALLLDCGLFQGRRAEALLKNRNFPFPPAYPDAVLLSHAHIDHCGLLPRLAGDGFAGPVIATRETADLLSIMLMDSARLQEADAKFFNKIHAADGETIEPLYGEKEAEQALALLRPCEPGEVVSPAAGARARFLNAGHVLGSSMIQVDFDGPSGPRRLLYTGDLGRREVPLMRPPEPPPDVDYLVMESTYGGRTHEPAAGIDSRLADLLRRAEKTGARIIIPAFALERSQEIIVAFDRLRNDPSVPRIPVYVDSPMAVNITEVFKKHLSGHAFDRDFKAYAGRDGDPFGFDFIKYVRSKEESQALNDKPGPMIIISASGMCEGGRVLHHLRNHIGQENTVILMVGYQAAGTLGRRLQDGQKKVRIFGLEHEVAASVETMPHFSSHADRDDILAFIKGLERRPRKIFLVHGEDSQRDALAEALTAEGYGGIEKPGLGETFVLD
ncbi:MAG: MBL fold metallo-hydrolase [Elusimicrobiota bacterium]